jgi:hypothetical protein
MRIATGDLRLQGQPLLQPAPNNDSIARGPEMDASCGVSTRRVILLVAARATYAQASAQHATIVVALTKHM